MNVPRAKKIWPVFTSRTEAPQQVSTDSILWLMDAMQLREVGKLVVYLRKMRWLHQLR